MDTYSINSSEYKNFDVFGWASETFEKGNTAYTGNFILRKLNYY